MVIARLVKTVKDKVASVLGVIKKQTRYARAAQELKCEEAAIRAFAEVESSGNGWLRTEDKPKIRFEDHIFPRYSRKSLGNLPPRKMWKSGYHKREWERFEHAAKIDRDAAILSTSWRAFQIMGFNHERVGFETLEAFYEAMNSRDYDDLDAFVAFIKSDKALWGALQKKAWRIVAKKYNGNSRVYAPRLERAYNLIKEKIAR